MVPPSRDVHITNWGVILKYSLPVLSFTQPISDGCLLLTPEHLLKPFFPCLLTINTTVHPQSSVAWSSAIASSSFICPTQHPPSPPDTTLQPSWLHLSSLSMPHSLPPWGLGASSCSCMEHTFPKPSSQFNHGTLPPQSLSLTIQ